MSKECLNGSEMSRVLKALEIANKRIDELEKYNLDLANESHNKALAIDRLKKRFDELDARIRKAMPELKEARSLAMHNTVAARIPECGDFGCIAQSLDWVCSTLSESLVNSKFTTEKLSKEQEK